MTNKDYIIPRAAFQKLKMANRLRQTVYIYGATGYGKTELVNQYLKGKLYIYLSCKDDSWDDEVLENILFDDMHNEIVVIDDMQLLKNEEKRQKILELAVADHVWLIMLCRSQVPSWIMSFYIKEGFVVIREEDLWLGEKEIEEYFSTLNFDYTEEDVKYTCNLREGNAYVIKHTAMLLKEGMKAGEELTREIGKAFVEYLEKVVILQWDSDLLEFLMQMSVVEEFEIPLAEIITGSHHINVFIDKAADVGNFLSEENGIYRLRPQINKALYNRGLKVWGRDKMNEYTYNAGLYYEMQDDIIKAISMYEKCGNQSRIVQLLIRNARRNPGNGHYFELKKYYLNLQDEDIESSVILMAGMSMMYSLLLEADKSEYWYDKLRAFEKTARGGEKREAVSRLAYLDIALPHRGSSNTLSVIKSVPKLLFDKGIGMPEFSVTSNLPSTMNGGKDFCHWSKKDRELVKSIGKILECVLGRYGKGIVNVALAESLYEKAEDKFEILTLLSRGLMEIESGGMMEIAFAAIGIQVRLNLLCGNEQGAKEILSSFEKKIIEQGANQLLPNLNALKCRIALYDGRRKTVERWMQNEAPDENKEFFILDRYRYLTKIRCYIAVGDYLKAYSLLEKMKYYADKCNRPYISMEANMLIAITKERLGEKWKDDMMNALKNACDYRFVRVISEEGAAVFELLRQLKNECKEDEAIDNAWFANVLTETKDISVRYPVYLKRQLVETPDFSENALTILRLQAEGLSVKEIAEKLGMKLETVRYHTKQNYRKLGVSGKADAVLAARNLNLL